MQRLRPAEPILNHTPLNARLTRRLNSKPLIQAGSLRYTDRLEAYGTLTGWDASATLPSGLSLLDSVDDCLVKCRSSNTPLLSVYSSK